MPSLASFRSRFRYALPVACTATLLSLAAAICSAATVRGVVIDPSGAKVTGATVALVSNGKVVTTAVSAADGSFQIQTGEDGRFFLVITAKSFRQL